MPAVGMEASDGMHFCRSPVVPCSHAITGREPGGETDGAKTVAAAVAGVLSSTVVV